MLFRENGKNYQIRSCVEHKSLSHNKFAIFRVVVSLTLKMANYLITNLLHSTPY